MPILPRVKLNGEFVETPRNWQDFSVLATYDNSSVQANVTTTQLEFVNNEAQKIIEWFEAGLNPTTTANGCFQGMPIELSITEATQKINAFTGIIDFTDEFEITNSVNTKVKLKSLTGLNILDEQLEGVSFALLAQKGVFTNADNVAIPYIEDHDYSDLEVAVMSLTFFILTKELIDLVFKLVSVIAETSGGIFGIAVTIIQGIALAAYGVALVVQLIKLIQELYNTVFPIKRYFNGMPIKTILTKVADFFGLNFKSSITELDSYVFLPSQDERGKTNFDNSISGLPSVRDEGYIVSRFFAIVKDMFYAKWVVNGDDLYLEPLKNEDFWFGTTFSQYEMPSKLIEYRKYNINELKSRELISFSTDPNETFTYKNFDGTNVEIKSNQGVQATVGTALSGVNITEASRVELLKGANDVRIPWALGTRKGTLTPVEELFSSVYNIYNSVSNFIKGIINKFGGNLQTVNFNPIELRKEFLKVSQSEFGVAKILNTRTVSGEKLLGDDYRTGLNAEYLWDNFHKEKSFKEGANPNGSPNQWRLFTDEVFDFSFEDFVKLTNNAYFYANVPQSNGTIVQKKAKAEKLEWNFGRNQAKITYRVREVYNNNIDEQRFT